jgi:hypothetical protein
VRRHISASKACFAADLGYKEIHVEAARRRHGGGGWGGWSSAGGSSPTSRYSNIYIFYYYVLYQNNAAGIAVKESQHYALGVGFETRYLQIFAFCIFLCTYKHELVHSMYIPSIYIAYIQHIPSIC